MGSYCNVLKYCDKRKEKITEKKMFWKMKNEAGADQPQLNLTAVCYIATFSLLLFVVWTLAWPLSRSLSNWTNKKDILLQN